MNHPFKLVPSADKYPCQSCVCENSQAKELNYIYGCLCLFLQESFLYCLSSVADETQDSLHTDNEIEQSTEEFLLTDCDYDVLPSRKGVYNQV